MSRSRIVSVDALFQQAVSLQVAGDHQQSQSLYCHILKLRPDHLGATYNLVTLLLHTGQRRACRDQLAAILKRRPNEAEAHFRLGLLERQDRAFRKSLFHLRRAVALNPQSLHAALELIRTHGEAGEPEAAADVAGAAAARFPRQTEIPAQLGVVYAANGRPEDARAAFDDALAIDPTFLPAIYNRAKLADDMGDLGAALELVQRAQALDPDFVEADFNVGALQLRMGLIEQAIPNLALRVQQRPDDPDAISEWLGACQFEPGVTAASLLERHRRWDARPGAPRPLPASASRNTAPDRPLKVGLVSADMRQHPVGFCTIGFVECADPAQIELSAYANSRADDDLARRFKRAVHRWRDATSWSDATLAAQIAADQIDILLDLSGHTRGNRLAAFDYRPAPIQISWGAYVGTTGLRAMDGLIADRFHVPFGEEACYSERIIRLPDSYVCFDLPTDAPPVAPLPAGDAAPLTFAAFHNPSKINADVVALWARAMRCTAGSTIQFVYGGYDVPDMQRRILDLFADGGIAPQRVRFHGRLSRRQLLERYGSIDVALDPFPFSGGVTTCEAIWMGVPVVTLAGARSFAGRHSLGFSSAAGVTETIAQTPDDYVDVITRLDADRAGLAALRAGLRERMRRSPLCDRPRFARNMQDALRQAWRAWCATQGA